MYDIGIESSGSREKGRFRPLQYEKPAITDLGSIADHTFTNTGQVPGQGPKGKNRNHPEYQLDKFDEPSHS